MQQMTNSIQKNSQPPANTLHVNRWSDLPDCTEPAVYRIHGDGSSVLFSVSKKRRQVLEGLMQRPLACSSKCRLSQAVLTLRRDCGLVIEMRMFDGSEASDGDRFGIYFLKSEIERVEPANDN